MRGVIHERWVVDSDELQQGLTELETVGGDTLAERKNRLMSDADAIISLPGGPGTFDELFEAISDVQLGFRSFPIVLVNTDGFYEGLRILLTNAQRQGLQKLQVHELVSFADTPEEALEMVYERLSASNGGAKIAPRAVKRSQPLQPPQQPQPLQPLGGAGQGQPSSLAPPHQGEVSRDTLWPRLAVGLMCAATAAAVGRLASRL